MKGIYMMADYPDTETFRREFIFSQNCGLDFVEIGLPFNDPVADGPVIAEAGEEVIKNSYNIMSIMDFVGANKKTNIYVMTYSNIIYSFGAEQFTKLFGNTVDGVIIADLPNKYHYFFREKGFDVPIIPFATSETSVKNLKNVLINQDFIYFVGLKGVTGSKTNLKDPLIRDKINVIKKETEKKVVFGFGIKNAADAAEVMTFADGFVVGTEVVKRQPDINEFEEFVRSLTTNF